MWHLDFKSYIAIILMKMNKLAIEDYNKTKKWDQIVN